MTRQIEDRLRAAIEAKTATVTETQLRPWSPPDAAPHRASRRALIWIAPLATAAAVLLIIFVVTGIIGPNRNGSAPADPVSSPSPAARSLDLRSMNWKEATIPGSTCLASKSLKLHAGHATVPASPSPHEVSLEVGYEPNSLVYGPVEGAGTTDAAVLTECYNPGRNGSAQLLDSIVVFSGQGGALHVLGVLHPVNQKPSVFTTRFQDIVVSEGRVSVKEIFYGPMDSDAAPSGHATTVFTWTGGRFRAHSTITQQPRPQPSSAPTGSAPTGTAPTGTAPTSLDPRSVNWREATIPGETCYSSQPIALHSGRALLPATPRDHEVMLDLVYDSTGIAYGPVEGSGTTDAALLADCSFANGTGASDLVNSLVVFSGRGGALQALSVLHPVNQPAGVHVTIFKNPVVSDGRITVTEYFYGAYDNDASPSGRATTVFTYSGGAFAAHSTITQEPNQHPIQYGPAGPTNPFTSPSATSG